MRKLEKSSIREGATESTAVVSGLLSELVERGLDFSLPRLHILDGGKALHAAVRRHAGEAAFIQRCQVHKKRNVVDHLPDEHKAMSEGNCKTPTRWRTTPTPSVRWTACIAS